MRCSSHQLGGRNRGSSRRLLAAQVALGALGAVVGGVELATDEQHLPVGAFLPQPARAVGRGEASADQQVLDLAGRSWPPPPYSPGGCRTDQWAQVGMSAEDPPAGAVLDAVGADVGAVVERVQPQMPAMTMKTCGVGASVA